MNIVFRQTKTKRYTDTQRKYLLFEPIFPMYSACRNYISTTANDSSIDAPLSKIIYAYNYEYTKISLACSQIKIQNKDIDFVYSKNEQGRENKPFLILIKQTYGGNHQTEYLFRQMLSRVNEKEENFANLHFTHFGLISQSFPHQDLEIIYKVLMEERDKTKIKDFYIDIDKDFFIQATNLYKKITNTTSIRTII